MAAGTIPISMTQQLDVYAQPLAGAQLYIITAGTVSTPQDAFQDVALTIKQPYPMTLDAAGRVPQFFLDNTTNAGVKVRLQDKNGVVQLASDFVLIIGPAGGTGGGGTTVDPSAIYQTGDIKPRYGVGVHPGAIPGWVRCNGLTIGSSISGASMPEGARPECIALFQYLWNTDPNLAVVPTRGASASADWTANKQIATPDFRGYALTGMDDMGNTPSGRLTAAYFGLIRPTNDPNSSLDPTKIGAVGGGEGRILAQNQLPNIVPTFTGTAASVSVTAADLSVVYGTIAGPNTAQSGGGIGTATGSNFRNGSAGLSSTGSFTPVGTISSINGNVGPTGLITLGPRKLCTIYIKL